MFSGVAILLSFAPEKSKNNFSKLGLHLEFDLCIIIARPPPRWAKWSRGVRTRGLRVGLVGGPRPLYFLGHLFYKDRTHAGLATRLWPALTFKRSGIIYGTGKRVLAS